MQQHTKFFFLQTFTKHHKGIGFLRLMRPANIVTAVADILAGVAISGYLTSGNGQQAYFLPVLMLCLATMGLYGGGVVLNDVFDAELDKTERPERPIPSGLIQKSEAAGLGFVLLLFGVICAGLVHAGFFSVSLVLAVCIAVCATVYDKWGKHHRYLGPVNMGLCRGLNLLLGISIIPAAIGTYWYLGIVPVVYIAAITAISRGEVHGGKKVTLYWALFFYLLVITTIILVSVFHYTWPFATPFVLLFGVVIFPPLFKAIRHPAGPNIGRAVKFGVLALILMNAAWAAAFGAVYLALLLLLLLPLSLFLARAFAVT